jgi:hypothetical protein
MLVLDETALLLGQRAPTSARLTSDQDLVAGGGRGSQQLRRVSGGVSESKSFLSLQR